jgi:hypothetical protein
MFFWWFLEVFFLIHGAGKTYILLIFFNEMTCQTQEIMI